MKPAAARPTSASRAAQREEQRHWLLGGMRCGVDRVNIGLWRENPRQYSKQFEAEMVRAVHADTLAQVGPLVV